MKNNIRKLMNSEKLLKIIVIYIRLSDENDLSDRR